MKKKIILSSIMTIVLCLCIIAGSTYALFTSEDYVNIAVTSGKVALTAVAKDNFTYYTIFNGYENNTRFENGGNAEWDLTNKTVKINRMTPGDKVKFTIEMTNESDVDIQYRVAWTFVDNAANMLNEVLVVEGTTSWAKWEAPQTDADKVKETEVTVTLPTEVGNDYQEKSGAILFTVYAIQGNGIVDPADLDTVLDNAAPGSTITLAGADFGDIVIDQELTDVTIVADPATTGRFKIAAAAKLDNVTFENLNIVGLDGFGNLDGVISIDAGAQADITFKNCGIDDAGRTKNIENHKFCGRSVLWIFSRINLTESGLPVSSQLSAKIK